MSEHNKNAFNPKHAQQNNSSTPRPPRQSDSEKPKRRNEADKFSDVLSGGKPRGAAGALIELDKELMKLLVRRATLVSRIRGGKNHASTPQAILEEKSVRKAFEENALSFSKDPKFTRELFTLLQEIKVLSKEEAEAKASFCLAPRKGALKGDLTAPRHAGLAQIWLFLAAMDAQPVTLELVPSCSAIMDTIGALKNLDYDIQWHSTGTGVGSVVLKKGKPLNMAGKTVFAGNSLFGLYALCFLAAGRTGVTSLTGGPELKKADLSSLRNLLPMLGARLASTMPRSTGLPARLECSGLIPDSIEAPENITPLMLAALLACIPAWGKDITVNLESVAETTVRQALGLIASPLKAMQASYSVTSSSITFEASELNIPAQPALPIDPVAAAYFLAMPVFQGGKIHLKGTWDKDLSASTEVKDLLESVGLTVTANHQGIAAENRGQIFQGSTTIPQEKSLWPLCHALSLKEKSLVATPVACVEVPGSEYLAEICSRLGLEITENAIGTSEEAANSNLPWTAPNAEWGMAFALGSFVHPNVYLANPALVSDVYPVFWPVFNSLPDPIDPAFPPRTKEQDNEQNQPARRRIIAE